MIRRDAYFKTSLTNVVSVFPEVKDRINAIISWYTRQLNHDNYHGYMFIRAQAEYGNKDKEIYTIVRAHKQWVQDLIYQSRDKTKSGKEVSAPIALMLECMITYTIIFVIENNNFATEKSISSI